MKITRRSIALPEPPSANRWWRRAGNRIHLSNEARKYKENIAQLGGRGVLDGPVRVTVDWYRSRKSGDLDKRLGVVLDALQGVFYASDAQIVALAARRFEDPKNPRVEITVEAA